MSTLAYIHWDISPVAFTIGSFEIRWYSMLFALGIYFAYVIIARFYKNEGIPQEQLDRLTKYVVIGIVAGARLGHCLFYEPGYYLAHPLEMILPFKGWPGQEGFEFTGFRGLASHGGAIGILFAVWLYTRKTKIPVLNTLDRLAVVIPLTGASIRTGNLMNSEIVGRQTDVSWAFIFEQLDQIPRHPAQVYEALSYLGIFLFLYWFYNKKRKAFAPGKVFALFLMLMFSARFIIEFIKENQEAFENGLPLNMGQLLSIPFILVGLWLWQRKTASKKAE